LITFLDTVLFLIFDAVDISSESFFVDSHKLVFGLILRVTRVVLLISGFASVRNLKSFS